MSEIYHRQELHYHEHLASFPARAIVEQLAGLLEILLLASCFCIHTRQLFTERLHSPWMHIARA